MERKCQDKDVKMRKTLLILLIFFLTAIALISSANAIKISENVQFSFGCDAGGFPKNCSGNYYFKQSNLTFWHIELFHNRSRWNDRDICRHIPFFQYVWDYPDIFNWECCISEWQVQYGSCQTNDTQLKYYVDTRSCFFPTDIPVDNSTYVSCNYCSEDLFQTLGMCMDNSTQTVDYQDLNQNLCCDVTNLPSDCTILTYPYNETTYQSCNSTNAYIGQPNCRKNPEIGENVREDCVVEIPLQYQNEGYKCFSLVKEKQTGQIVQVNPDRNRTSPVYEQREYFEPLHSTINFYYTAENLIPETEYTVRVECSTETGTIYSEYDITRSYENMEWVFYRIKWLKGNAPYFVGGLIVIFIISLAIWLLLRW